MRRSELPVSIFYLCAFLLALFSRLLLLGKAPLTDYEASWALQAVEVARGSQPLIGAHSLYVSLTSLLFYIFPISEFWARFVPAVLGSLAALVPFLIRRRIGETPAVILAFAVAVDPGLLAAARAVGSPGLSLVCLVFVLVLVVNRAWGWAAFFAALAWMSGPQVWVGVLVLGLSLVLLRVLNFKRVPVLEQEETSLENTPVKVPYQKMVWVALGTILVVGSIFVVYPRALSASFNGLASFLAGWAAPSGVPTLRILAALVVYAPLPVIFGLAGAVRTWLRGTPLDHFLTIWAALGLLAILLYPARQVSDLVWVILPLWGLAVRQFERLVPVRLVENRFPTLALAVFVGIVWGYVWLNLVGLLHPQRNLINLGALLNNPNLSQSTIALSLIMVYIALVLMAAVCLLIAWGWSSEVGMKGFAWGSTVFLAIFTLAASTSTAGYKPQPRAELWDRDTGPAQANLLAASLDQLSELSIGRSQALEIVVVAIESPALRWLLRDEDSVSYISQLPAGQQPGIVLTWESEQPQLASAYRGQDFTWMMAPEWNAMLSSEFLPWLAFRQVPWQTQNLILWARADLFPDAALALTDGVP